MSRKAGPTKGDPFSIRLSRATDEFVASEARRTRRSKSAVVELLTEEAARMRRFPGIAFRGHDADRRAWVIGTGLDVWQIVDAYRDFQSVQVMATETDLTERQIALALAYAEHYPDEIEAAISENHRPLSELRQLYPTFVVEHVSLPA